MPRSRAAPLRRLCRARAKLLTSSLRLMLRAPRLHRDAEHLRDRVPTADDETAAAGRERAPEVGQRLEEEGDAVRGAEAGEQLVVEDEDRDDMRRVLDGGVEGGMVVHAGGPG